VATSSGMHQLEINPGQDEANIPALETSHHNMLLLNSNIPSTLDHMKVHLKRPRRRLMKIFSDHPKSYKSRIRMRPRRKTRRRCHPQADRLLRDRKPNRTRRSLALLSKPPTKTPRCHQNPKFRKNLMRYHHKFPIVLGVPHHHDQFQLNHTFRINQEVHQRVRYLLSQLLRDGKTSASRLHPHLRLERLKRL